MDDMDLKKVASEEHEAERRKFLAQCGRFAIATPPALAIHQFLKEPA